MQNQDVNCILYCFSLNNLLDGGLYTSEITEIAGEISAGKTQVKFSGETHKLSEIVSAYKCIIEY